MFADKKEREFEKFYKRYYKIGYRYLRAKRFPYNHIRDVLDHIFMLAWSRFDEYLESKDNQYWFYNMLRNNANYAKYKLNRDMKTELNEDIRDKKINSIEEQYIELEKKSYLFKSIMELPDIYRDVTMLRLEGFKYIEIGEFLEITVDTARKRMKRAIDQLKDSVKDYIYKNY